MTYVIQDASEKSIVTLVNLIFVRAANLQLQLRYFFLESLTHLLQRENQSKTNYDDDMLEGHPLEPCFPEIFRTPWSFSFNLSPMSSLSVLIPLPLLPLRCPLHFKTYDSFGSLCLEPYT